MNSMPRSLRPFLSHLLQFLVELKQLILHLVHFLLCDIRLTLGMVFQLLLDLLDAILHVFSGGQCICLDLMDIAHGIREKLLVFAGLLHLFIFVLTTLLAQTSIAHDPLLLADSITEFLIMGNHQHTTSPRLNGDGQSTQSIAIQIIGGLIQHQNMGVLPHACTENCLDLLTGGQRPDGSVGSEFGCQAEIAQVGLNGGSAQNLADQPCASSLNLILTLALLLVAHGKQHGSRHPSARHVHAHPLHLVLICFTLLPLSPALNDLQSDSVFLILRVILLLALSIVPDLTFLQLLVDQLALHDLLFRFLLGCTQIRHSVQRLIVLRTGKPLQHVLYGS
mmetsp:Transcript_37694/g.86328  ORF Transcript_37694/g.86328 Transcript_37694/m.86328 type:complete len:336 (-) Transcript_37694:25-1032(-)